MKLDMSFLQDGELNNCKIETFEVPENCLSQQFSMFKTGRGVPGGKYKILMIDGEIVMSNTPDEIRDFSDFTRRAKGSVLINGLGMGCVIKALLDKPGITKITVIEINENVIKLVAPYFNDARLIIINDNAFEYKVPKGETYDFVYHDIWNYICTDNLSEMTKLHRKYSKITNWQDSWAKKECKNYK